MSLMSAALKLAEAAKVPLAIAKELLNLPEKKNSQLLLTKAPPKNQALSRPALNRAWIKEETAAVTAAVVAMIKSGQIAVGAKKGSRVKPKPQDLKKQVKEVVPRMKRKFHLLCSAAYFPHPQRLFQRLLAVTKIKKLLKGLLQKKNAKSTLP